MDVAVSNRVVARNGIGRFISECEAAGQRTVEKAVRKGTELSRRRAPVGHKPDSRTVTLKEGMFYKMTSRTSGYWGNTARHAMPVEFGAAPHDIPATVSFYWEKMGRMWMVPEEYLRRTGFPGADPIHHPGNASQPYLRPAYKQIMGEIMQIARQEYPN
jgi:hypothetical protein